MGLLDDLLPKFPPGTIRQVAGVVMVKLNGVDLSRQYAFVAYAEKPDDVLLFPEPGRTGILPEAERVRRHSVNPVYLQTGLNFITLKSYKKSFTVTDVELAVIRSESNCTLGEVNCRAGSITASFLSLQIGSMAAR